jgi:hypothetical protein
MEKVLKVFPRNEVADSPRHNNLLNRIVHALGVRTVWLELDRRLSATHQRDVLLVILSGSAAAESGGYHGQRAARR